MEEEYIAEMDAETINQDFDDIDLYGEKLVEDEGDCDIEFEQSANNRQKHYGGDVLGCQATKFCNH